MKILHVLNSDSFSGAENVVCQIAGMFRSVPDVEMIYCSREGKIRQALEERDIPFASVSDMTRAELKRVIREQKPDVIHAHDMRASLVAALACGNLPLISHIHNNHVDSRGLSVKSIAYFYAAMRAKHIFWVSQSSFDGYCFHNRFRKKSTVLYNMIDVDALYAKMRQDSSNHGFDVIYLGRLTEQKNPQRLMAVCAKITAKLPDVRIAVVGTGELAEETEALGARLGLLSNVHFLGFQNNPLKMLHDAKVMLMTSRWEGTPMCALEAMALGVPIVSTPTDGMNDLVEEDITGYLSDRDEVLCEKIVEIVTSPSLRERLGSGALKRSEKLNNVADYRRILLETYRRSTAK